MRNFLHNVFGGEPSHTPYSRIVFAAVSEGHGIFTVNPDGTGRVKIRSSGTDVKWSPNGQWIAFVEYEEECDNQSIWVMRPDGSSAIAVACHYDASTSAPTWSPDSNQIAYSHFDYEKRNSQIWITNLQNGQTRAITQSGYDNPTWLASNEIVFHRQNEYEQFIINNSGVTKNEFLTNLLEENSNYSFSQNASKIAFIVDRSIICIMDSDGSNCYELDIQIDAFQADGVKWSPDNQCLLFVVEKEVFADVWVWELWAVSIAGANKWLVDNGKGNSGESLGSIRHFSWSPWL